MRFLIEQKKAQVALEELEDRERPRKAQREAARRAEENEARREQREREAEQVRRDRERENEAAAARAAQARLEWEAEWLRSMLYQLPPDVPPELRLEVADVVRHELAHLYEMSGYAEDFVEENLRVAVERSLRPWRRSQEAVIAADEAVIQLHFSGCWGKPNEDIRTREEARSAIAELPETATLAEMQAVARSAGHRVAQEYQRGAEQEPDQRKREEEADTYLWNVLPYLYELQAAKQKLIDDPSLTWLNAKQRVREFVDEWIANSLNERQG